MGLLALVRRMFRFSKSAAISAKANQDSSKTQLEGSPPIYQATSKDLPPPPGRVHPQQSPPEHWQRAPPSKPSYPPNVIQRRSQVPWTLDSCIVSAEQGHLRDGKPFTVSEDSTANHFGRPVVIAGPRFFNDIGHACTPEDTDNSYCMLDCYLLVRKALKNDSDKPTLLRLQVYRQEILDFVTKFFGSLNEDSPYEGDIKNWWIYRIVKCIEAKNVNISWGKYNHKCVLLTAEFSRTSCIKLRYVELGGEVPIELEVDWVESTCYYKHFRMLITDDE